MILTLCLPTPALIIAFTPVFFCDHAARPTRLGPELFSPFQKLAQAPDQTLRVAREDRSAGRTISLPTSIRRNRKPASAGPACRGRGTRMQLSIPRQSKDTLESRANHLIFAEIPPVSHTRLRVGAVLITPPRPRSKYISRVACPIRMHHRQMSQCWLHILVGQNLVG